MPGCRDVHAVSHKSVVPQGFQPFMYVHTELYYATIELFNSLPYILLNNILTAEQKLACGEHVDCVLNILLHGICS